MICPCSSNKHSSSSLISSFSHLVPHCWQNKPLQLQMIQMVSSWASPAETPIASTGISLGFLLSFAYLSSRSGSLFSHPAPSWLDGVPFMHLTTSCPYVVLSLVRVLLRKECDFVFSRLVQQTWASSLEAGTLRDSSLSLKHLSHNRCSVNVGQINE